MDANKIKFVDDDGSVEVLEPPMTARVHVETPTEELIPQETIEEEPSSSEEDIVVINSSVEGVIESVSEVQVSDALGPVSITEEVIEDAVEQNVKDLAKIDTILSSSVEAMQLHSAPIIEGSNKIDEVKAVANGGDDEIDKEALSLVANAVNDVRAKESALITPKGCCILQ
jgi:propanediol dehydratase large subunit